VYRRYTLVSHIVVQGVKTCSNTHTPSKWQNVNRISLSYWDVPFLLVHTFFKASCQYTSRTNGKGKAVPVPNTLYEGV